MARFLFFRNFAETDETGDSELSNIILPVPLADAVRQVESTVQLLPRWHIESINPTAGTFHLTRRTRLFRFVDDVHLTLEPIESGTRLRGRSQSRLGFTDLGQNRRNLLQLVRALRAR
jgi:uncharacterized protein (DUF1499 family)